MWNGRLVRSPWGKLNALHGLFWERAGCAFYQCIELRVRRSNCFMWNGRLVRSTLLRLVRSIALRPVRRKTRETLVSKVRGFDGMALRPASSARIGILV